MMLDPPGEAHVAEEELAEREDEEQDLIVEKQSSVGAEMEARSEEGGAEERSFINTLYSFMKERGTPIERIPHLGFKQINLWKIYQAVETLGGYEAVTSRRLWKNVYDELGGSPGSTSAATCTRRHYERLVLPYERQLRGEEDKPLPLSKPRKQYKRCPESKGSQTENQKKRQMEKEESEVHLDSEQTGTLSHHSPWSSFSDRTDSDHQSTVPRSGTRSSSGPSDQPLQTSQAEVISPLEKKKRLAQACLSAPTSCTKEDVGELERPSVIQLSHTHQTPACSSSTRTRHTSDGSPLPLSSPSGSFSRSPSPYSVSSEDCIAVSSQKTPDREVGASRPTLPTSESRNTRICKPVSCYASTREPASYPHLQYQKFFPAGQPHPNKNQRNIPQWTLDGMFRDTFLRLGSHNTKTCWVPAASSFTKVLPRDPCRSTFKPHLSYQQQQQLLKRPTTTEAFGPKMSSASPLSVTDRKEKAKALVTKSHLTQQYLWNPHNNQALPYIPHLETTRGDLPGQLKPPSLQPVLLPAHLTVPPGQTHPIHCPPMECSYLGQFEAAPPTWPCYSYPLWHPPAGYTMTGLQPY